MTKQDALRQVAEHTAALMSASTFAETTGVEDAEADELSDADADRLSCAVEEVTRRLRAMGQPRPRRFSTKRRRTT